MTCTSAEVSQTICVACNINNPGECVVQCNNCDRYYHYQCVGFKETSADEPWSCPECTGVVLSSTTRPSEDKSNGQSSQEKQVPAANSAANALETDIDRRVNVRENFRAQSLMLREDFQHRFDDLIRSYNRSSGRHELTVNRRTTASEHGSGETFDLIEIQSSQQVSDRNGRSIVSKPSKVKSVSSKATSKASSQRLRDIKIQKLQEEYELLSEMDEE